jgi:hypothetical protein
MDAAYAAFKDIEDNKWRAKLLQLCDAHRDVLAAAQQWDTAAGGLARLEDEHEQDADEEHTLSLRTVAAEAGLDIKDWFIGCLDDYTSSYYRSGSPLVDEVKKQIEEQTERLRKVGDLAGDR